MKNKLLMVLCVIVVLLGGGFVWWRVPVRFLDGVAADDVSAVAVFDGNTGQSFTIEDPTEIAIIVGNIQSRTMMRRKVSLGYSGYRFRVSFLDAGGSELDSFILNSSDTIRKDPFFYTDVDGGLCYEYLEDFIVVSNRQEDDKEDVTDEGMSSEPEMQTEGIADYPAMLRVKGLLYYDSGEISDALRCGMMDGQVTSSVDGVPMEDDQSNFGSGYGYQYGIDTIEVCIDQEWHIFISYDTPSISDWGSLSEEEKMELDPTYGAE